MHIDEIRGILANLISSGAAYIIAALGYTPANKAGETFTGAISATNLSGTNTGDQISVPGNAGTATALQTARTINGVSFDGTANITVTAAAGTLTGATLAAGVTASSLTSVGTLTALTVNGTLTANGNVNLGDSGADTTSITGALNHTYIQFNAFPGAAAVYEIINRNGAGFDFYTNSASVLAARLSSSGQFSIEVAGKGLSVKEGTNAKQGTATLVAGASVVANTSITATSRVFLTSQADGGTPGFLRVSARVAGTSFTITSSNAADTSTVAYEIFEPS